MGEAGEEQVQSSDASTVDLLVSCHNKLTSNKLQKHPDVVVLELIRVCSLPAATVGASLTAPPVPNLQLVLQHLLLVQQLLQNLLHLFSVKN